MYWLITVAPSLLVDHAARCALLLLHGYRYFISPLGAPCCRFRPSCSQYVIEAIRRYGFIHGVGLGIRRILRCHPGCPGGFDPVPGSVQEIEEIVE